MTGEEEMEWMAERAKSLAKLKEKKNMRRWAGSNDQAASMRFSVIGNGPCSPVTEEGFQ